MAIREVAGIAGIAAGASSTFAHLRHVYAVLPDVAVTLDQLVADRMLGVVGSSTSFGTELSSS
jgi:hypothetical protein